MLKTFGGYADSMTEIGDAISKSKIPVDVFVEGRAISAGAYIALCGNRIVISPDGVLGASQPLVTDGTPAPEKTIAAFRKMFRAVAEARAQRKGIDLDPRIAEAMVDPAVEVEGVVAKGEILALTAREALDHNYADLMADNLNEAIIALGFEDLATVYVKQTPVESLVRFLTDPVISPLLLTIGFTALMIEVFTAGFGVAGIIGIISLFLIFWGAYVFGVGWDGSDLSLLPWPDLTGGGSLFRTRFRFCRDFRFNFDGRKHHFILRFQWARGCRLGDRSHLVFLPGFPDFSVS